MQSLSKLQMFSSLVFFFFFASTTDGEFLRHETRRERLTNCRMEGKEKSITKLLRLSSAPFVLMVRCPEPSVEVEIGPEQAEMTGLVLERIQVGEGSICFSVRAWVRWYCDGIFCLCARSTEWQSPSSSLAHSSPVRMQGSDRLMIQWLDDSQIWGWE